MKRSLSFRARILLVVTVLAIFPLVLTGFWLTSTAARSGHELLQSRLNQYLESVEARVARNWFQVRSGLLSLGEVSEVQQRLSLSGDRIAGDDPPASLVRTFAEVSDHVTRATISDRDGRKVWVLEKPAAGDAAPRGPVLVVELPIYRRFPAGRLGSLQAQVEATALFAGSSLSTVAGAVLGAFDPVRETPLLALPLRAELLNQSNFSWGGDDWLAVRRELSEPPMRLVAAAPLAPFTAPFKAAADRGSLWLAGVALVGLVSAALITGRLTRRLGKLASAAESVSRGDLETHLDDSASDESGRVARAFNSMTASLRQTLDELAAREKLAAVGKFAAELAHEVRNPLTAIRINLQEVEESLPLESPLREPQQRALQEIERLDTTVRETLDRAKGKGSTAQGVELALPLGAAVATAMPAFAERNATLDVRGLDSLAAVVAGNRHSSASLEQLFLNLLLNAAAALGPNGRAWLSSRSDDKRIAIEIGDSGSGIPDDVLPHIFDPLFTTRIDGTGLGLTVAKRIVEEHGGRIEAQSEPGQGTTVRVTFPRVEISGET